MKKQKHHKMLGLGQFSSMASRQHPIGLEKLDEKPNLDFIVQGTDSITLQEGMPKKFCPHLCYCDKQSIDTNCFYLKFLHCLDARKLELKHPLNQVDKFYLRYKQPIERGLK